MMDIQDLQEIVKLMEGSGLSELNLEEGNFKLSLKRETSSKEIQALAIAPSSSVNALEEMGSISMTPSVVAPVEKREDKSVYFIKAPMVGTFYCAASPESAPFVRPGDKVIDNSVVCVLEAMKVMNEIHAECFGEIMDVLVENGMPVEYGQPLFKVKLNAL